MVKRRRGKGQRGRARGCPVVLGRLFYKAQVSKLACSAGAGCATGHVLRGALFCQVWSGACSVCPGCPGAPVLRKGTGGEPPAVTILWMAGRPAPLARPRGGRCGGPVHPGVRGRRPSSGGRRQERGAYPGGRAPAGGSGRHRRGPYPCRGWIELHAPVGPQ